MSLTATLTFNGTTDAATSAGCRSTGDALTPTVKGSQEMADANDATFIFGGAGSTVEWAVGAFTDLPVALAVESVTVVRRHRRGVGSDPVEVHRTRAVVRISGTNHYSTYVTCVAGYTDTSYTWTTNPATGGAWTPAALNAAQFGMEIDSDGLGVPPSMPEGTRITVQATYIPLPASVQVSRHLASMDLWLNKRPESYLTFRGSMDMLSVPLFGIFEVEHTAGPHPSANGWEDEVWERRPFAVHERSIDPMSMTVTDKLKDQRPIRCTMRDLACSDLASGSLGNGIARFSIPGAVFDFDRASEATYTNPTGESETVPNDTPAYATGGLQILAAAGARANDMCVWDFTETCIVWPSGPVTFHCEVNFPSVPGTVRTLVHLEYDANNGISIYYDPVSELWKFEVEVGGVVYTAYENSLAGGPSAGFWYQIGARMTGANGENGVAPHTLSLFLLRQKGTEAVASGPLVIPATGTWELMIGRSAAGNYLGGQIRKMSIHQFAMTDTEMQRTL